MARIIYCRSRWRHRLRCGGIASSNPAEDTYVRLLCLLCVVYVVASATSRWLVQRRTTGWVWVYLIACDLAVSTTRRPRPVTERESSFTIKQPVMGVPWRHVQGEQKGVKGIKCTLVQALRLCTGRTPHRGSRGIALPFYDHGTRRGWGVSVTPQPVPNVQESGWAPGPVWTGAENLALPTGIRSPDSPARSQSLYRLRYPAQRCSFIHS